jgi:formate dehydrogenase maturation protein FdhE
MRETWQRRIDRAVDLADEHEMTRPLLRTYSALLRLQRDCSEELKGSPHRFTGSIDQDLHILRPCVRPMLRGVATLGSSLITEDARRIIDGGDGALDAALTAGWREPSGQPFFPKLALQPYAEHLAAGNVRPVDRDMPQGSGACPFCGGAPQLATLESAGDADGGGRQLLCALCLTTWPFRRVLCAHCGEEDERRLGYFQSPAFQHLRVDACETCKHYLKTVDLTLLGLAVPIVDEVAGGSLDLWATEHGYHKIELNLVGL